ncbi:unnamed protein product, partial [Iphiclides podalirius]
MDVKERFNLYKLRIIRTIGKGTYGNVYLCEKRDTKKSFTIVKDIELNMKIQNHNQEIANEVKILSTMNHPNIIKFFDCYYQERNIMICMEYATRGNLAEYIAKKTSTVIGTPYYLAPELCEGKPYDTKSDVWALGCLLYEMCTHKRAFDSETLVGLVKVITSGSVHPIDMTVYDRGLQDLIDSMLSIVPEKRPVIKELMGRAILLPTIYTVYLDAGNDELLYLKASKIFEFM